MADKRFPTDMELVPVLADDDTILVSDASDSHRSKFATVEILVDRVAEEFDLAGKAENDNVLNLDQTAGYTPGNPEHPTNKLYVDNAISSSLGLKADKTNVLELNNTTSFDPVDDYHPATKMYVDTEVYSALSGVHATDVAALSAALDDHTTDVSNPHTVTPSQVGLDQVDNTADADKPVSTDTQTALDLKLSLVGGGAVVSDIELKDYSETLVTAVSVAGVLTLDYSAGNVFQTVLHENVTSIVVSNPPVTGKAGSITLEIVQDAATPRTVAWGSTLWNAGTAPTMTATVDAIDFYTFTTFDGGSVWFGFAAAQAMA